MNLSYEEIALLRGLKFAGNAYISAGEHNMALSLCERGLAAAWPTQGGFNAWRITPKGEAAIAPYESLFGDLMR